MLWRTKIPFEFSLIASDEESATSVLAHITRLLCNPLCRVCAERWLYAEWIFDSSSVSWALLHFKPMDLIKQNFKLEILAYASKVLFFFSFHNVLAASTTIYIDKHRNSRNIPHSHAAVLVQTDMVFAHTNTGSDSRSVFTWSERLNFPETTKWPRSLSLVSNVLALDVVQISSFSSFSCIAKLNNKMHKSHSEHNCT